MPRTRTKLKHLLLRGRTYYLKMAIPKDIQLATGNGKYLAGKKLIETLRTEDRDTAIKLRDARLIGIQREWSEIRMAVTKHKGIVQQEAQRTRDEFEAEMKADELLDQLRKSYKHKYPKLSDREVDDVITSWPRGSVHSAGRIVPTNSTPTASNGWKTLASSGHAAAPSMKTTEQPNRFHHSSHKPERVPSKVLQTLSHFQS